MQETLDAVAAYLAGPDHGQANLANVTWIVGDPLGGFAGSLPVGFVVPFEEVPKSKTAGSSVGGYGIDHDERLVEIVLVDDLRNYGDPEPVSGTDYFEQPGYRSLVTMAESVKAALRSNITLGGHLATSALRSIRWAPLVVDNDLYRACRMVLSATERRTRG